MTEGNNNVATTIITALGTLATVLGGPRLVAVLVGANSRRAKREDQLRDELRAEQASLRAEMKAQIADLQSKYEAVNKELIEWQKKYFQLEAEHRVLQSRFESLVKPTKLAA